MPPLTLFDHHTCGIGNMNSIINGYQSLPIDLGKGWLYLDKKVFGDDGILQLDYGTKSYSESVKKITVQHLLEQTDGWDNSLPDDCLEKVDQKEFIDCVVDAASEDVNFSPGTKWNFSTFGYVLLGRIIEKLAKIKDI